MPLPLLLIPLAAGAAKASAVGAGVYVAGGAAVAGATTSVGVSWWNDWRWWDPRWYTEQESKQASTATPDAQDAAEDAQTVAKPASSTARVDEVINHAPQAIPTAAEFTPSAAEVDTVADRADEPMTALPAQQRRFAIEEIVDRTIEVLGFHEKTALLKNSLRAWIIAELSKHQTLINRLPHTLTLNIDALINHLSKEIQYSLNEHEKINEPHQKDIYKARVIIGFQNWFFENYKDYLNTEETQLHEWSQEMRAALAILRNHDKDSREGKRSIERLLIWRTMLLEHIPKEVILQQQGDTRARFITSVTQQKYKSEGKKGTTGYNGISYNINTQQDYSKALCRAIEYAFVTSRPAQPRTDAASIQGPLELISLDGKSMKINPEYQLSKEQEKFIDTFTTRFADLYAKFHLIRNREVRRQTDNTEKGVAMTAQVGGALLQASAMSDGMIAAGNLLLHVIQSIIGAKKDFNAQTAARLMENLLPADNVVERVTILVRVGKSIAIRYQNQLAKFASDADIETFANCVAARITAYVTLKYQNSLVDKPSSWFSRSTAKTDQHEIAEIIMLKGLIDGRYKDLDKKPIRISNPNKRWTPENIIQSTGIIVRDPENGPALYTHRDTPRTQDNTALLYGCCYGCVQEAENRRYQPVDASRTTLNLGVLLAGSPWYPHQAVANEDQAAAAAAAPRPRAMR